MTHSLLLSSPLLSTFGNFLIFIYQTGVTLAAEDALASVVQWQDEWRIVAPPDGRTDKLSAAVKGLDDTQLLLMQNDNSKMADDETMRSEQRKNEKQMSELQSQMSEIESDLESSRTVSRVAELMCQMTSLHSRNNLKAKELSELVNALHKCDEVQRLEFRNGGGSHRIMTFENHTHAIHPNMRKHHLRRMFREIDQLFEAQFKMTAAEFLDAKGRKLRDIAHVRGSERELEIQRRERQRKWTEIRRQFAASQRELQKEMAEKKRLLTEMSDAYIRLWERHHFGFDIRLYRDYLSVSDEMYTELKITRRMNDIAQRHVALKRQRTETNDRYRVLNCSLTKSEECQRLRQRIVQKTQEMNIMLDECIPLMPRVFPFAVGDTEFSFVEFERPDTVHVRDTITGQTAHIENAMEDVVAFLSERHLSEDTDEFDRKPPLVFFGVSLAEACVFIKLKSTQQNMRYAQFNLHAKAWIMRDIQIRPRDSHFHSAVSEWWQSRDVLRNDSVLSKWPANTAVYWFFFNAMESVIPLMAAMYARNVPITLADLVRIQHVAGHRYAEKARAKNKERAAASEAKKDNEQKEQRTQTPASQKLEEKLGNWEYQSLKLMVELALLGIDEVIDEYLTSDFVGKRIDGRGGKSFLDAKVAIARGERGTVVDIDITDLERDAAKRWVLMRETFELFQAFGLLELEGSVTGDG